MFEDISRLKPRMRRKVSDGAFDLSVRPACPSIHGTRRALWPSGRPVPRDDARARTRPIQRVIKRGLDAGFALLALVALLVPLVVIFLVLRHRLVAIPTRGRNGRLFARFNFAATGPKGCVLAETGLDRLPELINVLKGDMSLIGPAPGCNAIPSARPGLAGHAETFGNGNLSLLDDFRILIAILLGRQG